MVVPAEHLVIADRRRRDTGQPTASVRRAPSCPPRDVLPGRRRRRWRGSPASRPRAGRFARASPSPIRRARRHGEHGAAVLVRQGGLTGGLELPQSSRPLAGRSDGLSSPGCRPRAGYRRPSSQRGPSPSSARASTAMSYEDARAGAHGPFYPRVTHPAHAPSACVPSCVRASWCYAVVPCVVIVRRPLQRARAFADGGGG